MGEVQKQKHSFQKKNLFRPTSACLHVCFVVSTVLVLLSTLTVIVPILWKSSHWQFFQELPQDKNFISVSISQCLYSCSWIWIKCIFSNNWMDTSNKAACDWTFNICVCFGLNVACRQHAWWKCDIASTRLIAMLKNKSSAFEPTWTTSSYSAQKKEKCFKKNTEHHE